MADNYDDLLKDIEGLAGHLLALNKQAVQAYSPIVENIINSRSRDTNHIEPTLDGLLDFCGDIAVLKIFKKLCRYYWEIDPNGAAYYVKSYREMWEM